MSSNNEGGDNEFEKRLWEAADQLRANSKLLPSQYSGPVLGLIFLKFADHRFQNAMRELKARETSSRRGIDESDYHSLGVMYVPESARWSNLLNLPEGADIGREISNAMTAIEDVNEDLRGALPRNYSAIENKTLIELMRVFDNIPLDTRGDLFGHIFEYFLGKFALKEGQGGGTFYTPSSVVRMIVEILEPDHGLILDPACGSGGMFVQSARFLENHNRNANDISIYGTEVIQQNVNLSRMNMAVHQLAGQIRQANSYYEDPFESPGKFDYVMANPPFNVDMIDKERIKNNTSRYPLGMPKNDNGNYIWIQMFYGALNENGKAGFVMANSAADARHTELEIRRKLIQEKVVDIMISVGTNFFYTVTLPCTLWFIDKGKKNTEREDKILFIDARQIYRQIDRAHRDFTDAQIEFISNIVRMYRGQDIELNNGSNELMSNAFGEHVYKNVPGLCKVATLSEIEEQGWSLNPGRYVGVADREEDDFVFAERLEEL
ncbi:MAG: class I SAM-dependent DNA methyltransferase, partial [archaeon]|nr:class I SAM-dependent DNA methyltransferase [archaeon]